MAKVTHYVILGIDKEHIRIKMLSWGSRAFLDSSSHHRVMEWTGGGWPLVLLIEFTDDGLSPSVRRFRRKQTWELVGIDE